MGERMSDPIGELTGDLMRCARDMDRISRQLAEVGCAVRVTNQSDYRGDRISFGDAYLGPVKVELIYFTPDPAKPNG